MDPCVNFQSQIASIMEALTKAAVAEISKLLAAESALALRVEMKRRDAETEKLLKRLKATETELQRVKFAGNPGARSVAVQVETSEGANDVLGCGGSFLAANRFCSEVPPPFILCKEASMESHVDLFQFEMKIEQVDESEEEKHCQDQCILAEQNHHKTEYSIDQRSSQLWSSDAEAQGEDGGTFREPDYSSGFEQRRKDFLAQAEQYAAVHVLIEDGSSSSAQKANVDQCNSISVKGVDHGEGIAGIKGTRPMPQTHRCATAPKQKPRKAMQTSQKSKGKRCPLLNMGAHSSSSIFSLASPCTQLSSKIQKQHSGGFKIYPCTQCGKRFTQRNRLVSHQWVHTGERPFRCRICGKMFSRQDNCHRHERLHSL